MSASLVGSEMCIRDSKHTRTCAAPHRTAQHRNSPHCAAPHCAAPHRAAPVSYTHLTLPTICSV
eukprot:13346081-Alexandrium_andersonii.AAC.1